jgi:hypothetical protein
MTAGRPQASAASRLGQVTKGLPTLPQPKDGISRTPMETFARTDEAAARHTAYTFRVVGQVATVVELGIVASDGVRVAHAATTGNPDHPAFNDAAGHGGGVLGGIAVGALMGAWCGPWCAAGGGIVGAVIGEAGMRKIQYELTHPKAHDPPVHFTTEQLHIGVAVP